jgi:hypothetical protein
MSLVHLQGIDVFLRDVLPLLALLPRRTSYTAIINRAEN